MRANVSFAPTIEGLRQAHCDPLILAIHVEEDALKGLTAEVDWRLAGQLTDWMRDGRFSHDAPILTPANQFLPAGRLLFLESWLRYSARLVRCLERPRRRETRALSTRLWLRSTGSLRSVRGECCHF